MKTTCEWHPLETAPHSKTLLLWGPTDHDDAGRVRNWKMETGYKLILSSGIAQWYWQGKIRPYDPMPTHWASLPPPPIVPFPARSAEAL